MRISFHGGITARWQMISRILQRFRPAASSGDDH